MDGTKVAIVGVGVVLLGALAYKPVMAWWAKRQQSVAPTAPPGSPAAKQGGPPVPPPGDAANAAKSGTSQAMGLVLAMGAQVGAVLADDRTQQTIAQVAKTSGAAGASAVQGFLQAMG